MGIAKKTGWLQPLLIKRTAGFTLIEIIVAIALIAIGILGFSLNTVGIIQGNFVSGNYTIATSLAQDKMEELLGQISFTNVDNCTNPPDQDITATGGTGGIYDRCWKIADPNPSLGANLKQIDVTVSWRDYLNRTVTVSTLVFTE
ncbi:MAG: prepilin-type N-terminal cleavage/methylation domain-containing protein [Candidatus Binatia bacterium]